MGIKTYRPYTPSRRQMTGSDFSEITKTTPEKSLLAPKSRQAGRNNQGKITVRHRGGGAKKKYRVIDFKRRKTELLLQFLVSNTIQTEQLISLLSAMKMVKKHISLHQQGYR